MEEGHDGGGGAGDVEDGGEAEGDDDDGGLARW